MHGWIRNPKAPSSLWDGLVLDGAYAGLYPGTNRFVDGSGLENHGTLTNMDASTDWRFSERLGQFATEHSTDKHIVLGSPPDLFPTLPATFSAWVRLDFSPTEIANRTGIFRSNSQGIGSAGNHAGVLIYTDVGGVLNVLVGNGTGAIASSRRSWQTLASLPIGAWAHVCVRVRSYIDADIWLDWQMQNVTTSGTGSGYGVGQGGAQISRTRVGVEQYNHIGGLVSPIAWLRSIAPAEISWLADRANRLYVPDTRRHFWFPSSTIKPWLYSATANHHVGMGLGV